MTSGTAGMGQKSVVELHLAEIGGACLRLTFPCHNPHELPELIMDFVYV